MASEGPLYPGTVATLSTGSESNNDWTNPGNVSADDGTEAQITAATFDSPDISYRLRATNFGFAIPAGATLDGITVEIDRRSIIANSGKDFRVQLQQENAVLVGDDKATATVWPTTLTIATYGGAADDWNYVPFSGTVADSINDIDFGVVFSASANIANADIAVDFIRVTVHYTASANQDTDTQLTGGGVLTATASGEHNKASQLVGGGILALATAAQKAIGVPLTGGGVLTPVTFKTSDRAIGLTGSGALNVTVNQDTAAHDVAVQLTASGLLFASVEGLRAAAAQVTAGGVLAAAAAGAHDGSAQLTGAGVLAAALSGEHNESAQLTGGGILAAATELGGQDVGLSATMDALAATAPVARKYAYPSDSVTVPCVVIGYPEVELDIAYGNAKREAVYPVYVLVGRVNELRARDVLDTYISSVPPALQGTLGGIVDYAGVKTVKVMQVTVGGIAYLAGLFSTEVMEAA